MLTLIEGTEHSPNCFPYVPLLKNLKRCINVMATFTADSVVAAKGTSSENTREFDTFQIPGIYTTPVCVFMPNVSFIEFDLNDLWVCSISFEFDFRKW